MKSFKSMASNGSGRRRPLLLAPVVVVVVVVVVALIAVKGQSVRAQSDEPSQAMSLVDMLLSPLRATLRQASRLFSLRPSDVEDYLHKHFDRIQVHAFKMFMAVYNKTYSPAELPKRMALFLERRKLIEESVRAFSEGKLTYMMRQNAYTDWDEKELGALLGASPPRPDQLEPEERELRTQNTNPRLVHASISVPAQKDWRASGCISEPMDQDDCGCCYAIATVNTLESMRCIKRIWAPKLSVQQVIDCSTSEQGCNGGWPTRTLNYLKKADKIARDACYPFVKREQTCKIDSVKARSSCTVWSSYSYGDLGFKVLHSEEDILHHVAHTGPVIIAMQVRPRFHYYSSGVYDDFFCSDTASAVNHAVSIVGYGEENGIDYWLVKNSWGTDWGDGGYAKVRRGRYTCSIGHWGWVITK